MKLKNIKTYGEEADLSMRVWIQLLRSYNKIRTKEQKYIQDFGLTMMQFQVLEVLYHRGDLSIGAITKLAMSTPGNITVVVRNLKKEGYIIAIEDGKDKRVSMLSISTKGKEIIEELFPSHAKNIEERFNVFTNDEKETMFNLLRKLQKSN